jgi:glutamine cyclotransferase
MLSCGGRRAVSVTAAAGPPARYTCRVVNIYPHDRASYTQGLYWHDGCLYEGTGEYGRSALQRVELASGRIMQSVRLDGRYFGEGIALLNGEIYQLTWREGRAFVYDAATFRPLREIRYTGEGWGLTTDGKRLYMSDGSEKIYTVDPSTFERLSSTEVWIDGKKVFYLNELEWIDGELWANVYTSDTIVRIDPATGRVVGVVDLAGLLPEADRDADADVLNGIAHDPATGRIFVTGKRWSKLFEIELVAEPY